jgi:hypothetical protein
MDNQIPENGCPWAEDISQPELASGVPETSNNDSARKLQTGTEFCNGQKMLILDGRIIARIMLTGGRQKQIRMKSFLHLKT